MNLDARKSPTPRSAYIHVPFCAHHCGYCNFTVIAGRDDLRDDFVRAVAKEISSLAAPLEVDTLYFGGGTPTQLSAEQWSVLWEAIGQRLSIAVNAEVTVEANPADANAAQMQHLGNAGVNRISLGAQSFHDQHLATLERDHRGQHIQRAFGLAREAGIASIAIDLIFAVPGQTLDEWRRDLDAALAFEPSHISTYGLTFDKGSAFYGRLQRGQMTQAPEELELAMYEAAIDALSAAGYEHYEVSNFAWPGQRSRHNEVYWTGQPYLAFGPGASRFIDGRRETNHRSVTTYLHRVLSGRSPVAEVEMLGPEDAARERLVFGLRRLEGVQLDEFARDTGFTVRQLAARPLDRFIDNGLFAIIDGRLRLTRAGLMISDSLWPELL